MCGIVLLLNKKGGAVPRDALERANAAIRHRGPDEQSAFYFENVGVAFSRLSIVDVNGGRQPIFNESNLVGIFCNGEIYNYHALRARSQADGHQFRTRSDSESILHLYESDPRHFIERLDGMFAFVLLDMAKREVILGRDRLGIKPLFLYDGADWLIVASEIKAILATGLVERRLDRQAIYDSFMFYYIPGRATAFQRISHVPPATILRVTMADGEMVRREYWQPIFPEARQTRLEAAAPYARSLRSTFGEAVGSQTIGDLPVATYLSGGIDSTVTALELRRLRSGAEPVKTYSIKFSDRCYDESPIFSDTVARFGFAGRTLESDSVDTGDFIKALSHLEQPQFSLLDIPMIRLSALAREDGTKVVLSGEGSDELFGGYFQFTLNQIRRALALPIVRGLRGMLLGKVLAHYFSSAHDRRLVGQMLSQNPAATIAGLGTVPAWWVNWQINDRLRQGLFIDSHADSLADGSAMHALCQPLKTDYAGIDDFNKSIYVEMKSRLPNYILARADRNAMANSVELRVPFLANAMVDHVCALPPLLKSFALKEKYILRKAFAGVLPPRLHGRMKFGYNAPLAAFWQTDDQLRDDALSEAALSETALFNPATVALWRAEAAATDDSGRRDSLYGMLTGVLSVQLLHRIFITP